MLPKFFFVVLVLAVVSVNAGRSLRDESFTEFLNRVERRDTKTKAICEIRADATVLLNPKVKVKDEIATFEFSRSFKTGDRIERFQFPVTDEVSREVNRISNYHEMASLKAKVEEALNAYRVFEVSDCRIRVGDTLEKADNQMAITRKVHKDQGQWAGRTYYIYEDGLIVECVFGIIQGARRDQDK